MPAGRPASLRSACLEPAGRASVLGATARRSAAMAQQILCFNAGSSSLKFARFAIADTGLRRILAGEIEEAGERQARFHAADAEGRALPPPDLGAAGQGRGEALLAALLAWIEGRG